MPPERSGARAALLAALVFAAPAWGQAPSAPSADFVTGGIGRTEADALRAQAASYPLEIVFAKATPSGSAFAAGVHLTVRDADGRTALSIASAEPIVLARLAPGRYTIEAVYEGQTRTAAVTVGGSHQKVGMTW